MLGGMDPKKMSAMMSQLGIKQNEIEAEEVVIRCADKDIVIRSPSVVKITMSGQEMFQISGKPEEVEKGAREEDIELVAMQAKVDKGKAKAALENNGGDIAAAILELKS